MEYKFIKDILRDKNSTKYSITKTLSLIFALILFIYIIVWVLIMQKPADHVLVVELMGFVSTLVGLKNIWGDKKPLNNVNEITPINRTETIVLDSKDDSKEEEAIF